MINKYTLFVQRFETATKMAKECALLGRNNAVKKSGNMWQIDCHCTFDEYNTLNEIVFGTPYEVEDDDEYWDQIEYSSHHSILDGGIDEPTMDEWERSGLL